MDGEDTDDTNLDMLVKTQAQFNAQHNISSIVQNAAAAAVAAVATNQQAQQQQVQQQQQQAAQLQQQLANIQSGHQSIQDQLRAQAQAAAQLQAAQQQAAGQQQTAGTSSIGRTQAEILKENLNNLKQEEIDSDCELVEDNSEVKSLCIINLSHYSFQKILNPSLYFSPNNETVPRITWRPECHTFNNHNSDLTRPHHSSVR